MARPPRGKRSQASLLLVPPPRSAGSSRLRGSRRPSVRLVTALTGLVLVAGGALAFFRAETGAASRNLSGGATTVPSTVRTSAPRTPIETAAAMKPSAPVRIIIPSLKVNAPVTLLGPAAGGSIQVPPLANHNLTGWYDKSVMPGQDGTSVILGHVDSYTGPSVFYDIRYLVPGELVNVVRANGSIATFAVDGVREVAKATFPSRDIYGNTSYPGLRLITCGGPFNTASRQYLDNIVVYTHLIG